MVEVKGVQDPKDGTTYILVRGDKLDGVLCIGKASQISGSMFMIETPDGRHMQAVNWNNKVVHKFLGEAYARTKRTIPVPSHLQGG